MRDDVNKFSFANNVSGRGFPIFSDVPDFANQVVGRRRSGGEADEDDAYSSSVSFLASDSEECEGHAGNAASYRAHRQGSADCRRDAQATKVVFSV